MNIEFQETMLYDTDQQQQAKLFHKPLTFGAATRPDYVLRPETDLQQPAEYSERYYIAEWVTPDSDGWASWNVPAMSTAGAKYGRFVLAVPSGDGWESYEAGNDLDTASYVVATE